MKALVPRRTELRADAVAFSAAGLVGPVSSILAGTTVLTAALGFLASAAVFSLVLYAWVVRTLPRKIADAPFVPPEASAERAGATVRRSVAWAVVVALLLAVCGEGGEVLGGTLFGGALLLLWHLRWVERCEREGGFVVLRQRKLWARAAPIYFKRRA